MLKIPTARLELIAATPGIARDEAAAGPNWYVPLGVAAPDTWPPPFNDATSQTWFARRIEAAASAPGWLLWYVIRRPDPTVGERLLIGNCGFRGAPDSRGSVEIGYSLLPSWHGHGYGTELAAALVRWAFSHAQLKRILAVTYPELAASIRVLEKNGFTPTGRGAEPRSLVFELRRGTFERRAGVA